MAVVSKEQIIEMIDMLPMKEQELAYELIKRMVLAWDNDFTKLTPMERERVSKADKEIVDGDVVDHSKIDWN